MLAALGPRMLELAAERSAGALTYHSTPEATAWARSILGGGSLLAVEQAVLLEEDASEARRIGREYIAFYLTLPNYVRAWERAGFGPEDLAAGGTDGQGIRTGADHVCLHPLDADPNALPIGAWRTLAPALHGR